MFNKTNKLFMGLNETDRATLVELYWERCKKALTATDNAISSEDWYCAANRIYYAVFYAVCTLFIKKGIPINSHRGIKVIFNKEFVATGKISHETSKILSQLETLRDKADYNVLFEATKEDIMNYRPKADAFIAEIKTLMDKETTDIAITNN
jgi:uncharacterized protein (UPF0332 family)